MPLVGIQSREEVICLVNICWYLKYDHLVTSDKIPKKKFSNIGFYYSYILITTDFLI